MDQDGVRYRDLLQTWSFTVQSDKDSEASDIAIRLYDWFQLQGYLCLTDNEIVVERISDITNRDNMISVAYEYRYGFDVDFRMRHEVERTVEENENVIETIDFKND